MIESKYESFDQRKHMLKQIGKKIFIILHSNFLAWLDVIVCMVDSRNETLILSEDKTW